MHFGNNAVIRINTMINRHISSRLIASDLILSSDDDQPQVEDLIIGYDAKGRLIIVVEYHDYDDERYNCCTYMKLSYDESRSLARRLKTTFIGLPRYISACMDEWKTIVLPTMNQVEACFKEVSDCLIDEGCRFEIKRHYGIYGFSCC